VTDDRRTKAGMLALIALAGITAIYNAGNTDPSSGRVVTGAGTTINITVWVLNAAPEILSIDYPMDVAYGNPFTVNFTVRDNNTLADLQSLKAQVWRPDTSEWIDYGSVEGPFDIIYGDSGAAWVGSYSAHFSGIADYGQSSSRIRVAVSDEANTTTKEMTILFYGYLSFDVIEGGTEMLAGPPGTSKTFDVVMDVTSNYASKELLCFYPGNLSISVDGERIGSEPVSVALLSGGTTRLNFSVRVDVPEAYMDDKYEEKLYFIVVV